MTNIQTTSAGASGEISERDSAGGDGTLKPGEPQIIDNKQPASQGRHARGSGHLKTKLGGNAKAEKSTHLAGACEAIFTTMLRRRLPR